jgi:hypothetical protein
MLTTALNRHAKRYVYDHPPMNIQPILCLAILIDRLVSLRFGPSLPFLSLLLCCGLFLLAVRFGLVLPLHIFEHPRL